MTSTFHRTLLNPQRFTDYLNGLEQEFGLHANPTKGPGPYRFNIYLGGLKGEFELMTQHIESIQAELDEYKEKVKLQTNELENVRRNSVCEKCRVKGSAQIIAPSRLQTSDASPSSCPAFQPESLVEPSTPLQAAQPVQLVSRTTSRSPDITVAHSQTTSLPSHFPQLPAFTIDPQSCAEKRSIIFNKDTRKELDIEMVRVLSHREQVWCVKFRKDGKYLAAGCMDGKVYIYHVQTGALTRVLRNLLVNRDRIGAVCFSGDGNYLASSSLDRTISIWEIKKKYVRNPFKGHTRRINSLEFSPNGRSLLSTSYDNTIRLWSIRDGATIFLAENNPTVIDSPGYTSAVFSPDGKYVAASHRDGVVRIWCARTVQLLRRVKGHTEWVFDIAFMPDGKGLITGGWDKTLKYWDISSLYTTQTRARSSRDGHAVRVEEQTQPERQYLGHQHAVVSLATSLDGRWILSGSGDHSVRIWDACSGEMQCILNNEKAPVYSTDFSPAGYLVCGGDDGTVRIWRCL